MTTKKKQLTEKQAIQIMTRRSNCIKKYRKSYKNKTITFSNPIVSSVNEISREHKKRVYKKKGPVDEEPVKKKRVYKKKAQEPVLEEPVMEDKPIKKRIYKKKSVPVIEEPVKKSLN